MRQQKIPAPSKLSLLSLEPEIQCLLMETCFWMIELVWSPLVQKALVVTLGAAVLSQIYALLSVKFWGLKMCECKKYDKYHVYLFQTLSRGCSSAPQVLWTQWRGHRICSVRGGPEVNTSFSLTQRWNVWQISDQFGKDWEIKDLYLQKPQCLVPCNPLFSAPDEFVFVRKCSTVQLCSIPWQSWQILSDNSKLLAGNKVSRAPRFRKN